MKDEAERDDPLGGDAQNRVAEHYVFDDVMSFDELLWLYHELISTRSWNLTRTSIAMPVSAKAFMGFPGLKIEGDGEIRLPFFSGYFRALVFRLSYLARRQHGLTVPSNIRRIVLNAMSSQSKTELHHDNLRKNSWTIVGFLNPVWEASDGGSFYLGEHVIENRPGRFIIFRSNTLHKGEQVTNPSLAYWRISLNIVLDDGTKGGPLQPPEENTRA